MENNAQNELFFYPTVTGQQRRRTIAGVVDTTNNVIRIGQSECSNKDMFEKKKGRTIAKGRALSTKATVYPLIGSEKPAIQFISIAKAL